MCIVDSVGDRILSRVAPVTCPFSESRFAAIHYLHAARGAARGRWSTALWVWGRIAREFDDRAWNTPAQVFAAPLELYDGRQLSAADVTLELQRLGYGPVAGRVGPGLFRRNGSTIDVGRRAFVYDGESVPEQVLHIEFRNERIAALEDGARQRRADRAVRADADRQHFSDARRGPHHPRAGAGAGAADRVAEGGGGSALRHSPRHRCARDDARGSCQRSRRRHQPGRQHAHDAARAQLLPLQQADVHAQDPRGADVARARAAAQQRRDHARVRQRDLSRPGRRPCGARLRPREPVLFRQAADRARRARDRAVGRDRARAVVLRSAPQPRARACAAHARARADA